MSGHNETEETMTMGNDDGLKLLALDAENVMRLRALHIRPDGKPVVIGGPNGAGKTSALNCVAFLLGGKDLMPSEPIRHGEKSGYVSADIGEYRLQRKIGEKTSPLTIVRSDGRSIDGTPQAVADGLFNEVALQPERFLRAKPAEQLAMMRQACGVDTRDLDARRAAIYQERLEFGRDLARAEGHLASLTVHDDVPEREVSVTELAQELRAARDRDRVADAEEAELAKARQSAQGWADRVSEIRATLADAIEKHVHAVEYLAHIQGQERTERIDSTAIEARMADAERLNRIYREDHARRSAESAVAELKAAQQERTDRISAIDAERVAMLAAARLPVDGLDFGENGLLFGGVPLQQASQSEQLRVAALIGAKLNTRVRFILIRDGALMDEATLTAFLATCEEIGVQPIIERVGRDSHCTVMIEDGEEVAL